MEDTADKGGGLKQTSRVDDTPIKFNTGHKEDIGILTKVALLLLFKANNGDKDDMCILTNVALWYSS